MDKATVEFKTRGESYGPFDMDRVMDAIAVLPKKYERGRPWIYVATRPYCECPLAVHPHGYDPKAAGRVLAEWGKAGWTIRTVSKASAFIGLCEHEAPEEAETVVYVAEKHCGCCVGVQPPIPGNEAGVAKVLQVWAEQGYYIQSIPLSDVYIEHNCPHEKPKEKQEMLPGLASADMEGLD